jgi:hypothetical protein
MKNKVFRTLKAEGLWIVKHNGPIDMVETTQIGFFAGIHPELIEKDGKTILTNKSQTISIRIELNGVLGPLPAIQIIPLNIPGMKTAEGKNQKYYPWVFPYRVSSDHYLNIYYMQSAKIWKYNMLILQ